MIEKLITFQQNIIKKTKEECTYVRKCFSRIQPGTDGPTALIWERGVGKTTLALQYLIKHNASGGKWFYFSADNGLITSLLDTGYTLITDLHLDLLIIDEIHKLTDRKRDLKSLIDWFPQVDIIILWSSSIHLHQGTLDLQRRVHQILVPTLDFSEFCKLAHDIEIPTITFDQLITEYIDISYTYAPYITRTHILEYLQRGHYPYTIHKAHLADQLILRTIQRVVLEDLPSLINLTTDTIQKVEKLFRFLAHIPPSDLTYTALAKKTQLSPKTIENVIAHLDKMGILNRVIRSNKTSDIIRKEQKIFLWNPNLYYAHTDSPNIWTIRESFVIHHLHKLHSPRLYNPQLILPRYGDVLYQYHDTHYLFEIWWANKSNKQLSNQTSGFRVLDDIMVWEWNILPLWLFGLLGPHT